MLIANIIKITYRNIRNDKAYSAINVLGLTIAITCSLFILMYNVNELRYDSYHRNASHIYRVVTTITTADQKFSWAVAQVPLADELKNNYAQVKNAVRFYEAGQGIFRFGDRQFYEDNFYLTDPDVFEVFTYDFIYGSPVGALTAPNCIVLTKAVAKKYFEDISTCVGQSIANQYGKSLRITGVIKDVPSNSSFNFGALISRSTLGDSEKSWSTFGVYTYIQLGDQYTQADLQRSLDQLVIKKIQAHFTPANSKINYQLQALKDIHLYSKIENDAQSGGDISQVYIFATVGLFLLIMASINYTNLATARSMRRAKEIAVRKILGATRMQLLIQFLAESFMMSFVALFLSIQILFITLPLFKNLSGRDLSIDYLLNPPTLFGMGLILIFLTLAGGSYPAIYLSGFNILNALKGKVFGKKSNMRGLLVVVQFTISLLMLISTLLVYKQMVFINNKDLGFDKNQVIRLNITTFDLQQKAQVLVENLKKLPTVSSVGFASTTPGKKVSKLLFQVENNEGVLTDQSINQIKVDYKFISTMNIKLIKGRDFKAQSVNDYEHGIIVNEALVRSMNWQDPVGKTIITGTGDAANSKQVIGVIRDYHQNSLYQPIAPQVLVLGTEVQYAFVKIKYNHSKTLTDIRSVWNNTFGKNTFEYHYLDDDFNVQYQGYKKRQQIFIIFTIVTLAIACSGLLGLAAYIIQQRSKEIMVRKVLGASALSLILLMSKEFLTLIGISILFSFPIAWYLNNQWLQTFAYRIDLSQEWSVFLLSGLAALMLTLTTLAYNIITTALMSPAKVLYTE